jgi:hypothetical protein
MPRTTSPATATGLPKISPRRGSKRPHNLAAFINMALEPQPAEVLIDTQFNLIVRAARSKAWRKAYWATQCVKSWHDFLQAARTYYHVTNEQGPLPGGHFVSEDVLKQGDVDSIKLLRMTIANQILTPSPTMADVTWKRATAKDDYLPISKEEIEAAIAADETFLAAHPTRRVRAKDSAKGGVDG